MGVPDLTQLDNTTAREALQALLDELAAARSAVATWQRRASGLRKMLDALVVMFPSIELPADVDDETFGRTRGPKPRAA